ncbi:MAG: DUF2867 domain-containing protein [Burkholderiaceae bacterium]
MQNTFASPVAVAIPSDARAHGFYAAPNLADAFAISLPPDVAASPEQLARYVFENQPAWVDTLMGLRDTLVAGFGLKTTKQLAAPSADKSDMRVGIFKIYGSTPTEVFLGEDDAHLDFRISVQLRPATAGSAQQLIVSTVVHCHNRLGRSYITVIAPFHRQVVQSGLRRAAKLGWPRVVAA